MGMSEGVLHLLFPQLLVLPDVSVYHLDHFLNCFVAPVQERCDSVFDRWVGPGASGEAFVHLYEFGDVRSSKEWGTHCAWEWHLLLFIRKGKGQELEALPLIVCMIGQGIGRRSSAGGGSGLA